MKTFCYFILQILGIFLLGYLVNSLTINSVEPITSLDWSQVEELEKNEDMLFSIPMYLILAINLLFVIKVITALIRSFKGNEKMWIWRYAIRGSFILLIIASIPSTINLEKLSQIKNLKKDTAEDIRQMYIKHINDTKENFIFDKGKEIKVYSSWIGEDSDTFNEYLAKYPPEKKDGIQKIDQLFKPDRDNYVCEVRDEKGTLEKVALYFRDPQNDNHQLKFFNSSDRLFWGQTWQGPLSEEEITGPGVTYETVNYSTPNGEYDEETAYRKARFEFIDNTISFDERRYTIKTGCWNRFECPTVTIGSWSNKFKMSCSQGDAKKLTNKVKSYSGI